MQRRGERTGAAISQEGSVHDRTVHGPLHKTTLRQEGGSSDPDVGEDRYYIQEQHHFAGGGQRDRRALVSASI